MLEGSYKETKYVMMFGVLSSVLNYSQNSDDDNDQTTDLKGLFSLPGNDLIRKRIIRMTERVHPYQRVIKIMEKKKNYNVYVGQYV